MTLTATADKSREFVERTAGFKQALREFEVPIEEALILSGPCRATGHIRPSWSTSSFAQGGRHSPRPI